MKFLLDSNLSHRVAQLLRDAGIDGIHVRDNDLQHATDLTILMFARQHSCVLVSEDTDFGELLAQQRTVAPSFVLLRTYEPMTPAEQAAILLANIPRLHDESRSGGHRGHRAEPSSSAPTASAGTDTRTAGALKG